MRVFFNLQQFIARSGNVDGVLYDRMKLFRASFCIYEHRCINTCPMKIAIQDRILLKANRVLDIGRSLRIDAYISIHILLLARLRCVYARLISILVQLKAAKFLGLGIGTCEAPAKHGKADSETREMDSMIHF